MVVRLLVTLILAVMGAVPASAGPWPRDRGAAFLALSQERSRDGSSYSAFYSEYGLGPRLTLGLELGRTQGESNALLWLQWARDPAFGANRWSTALGLGVVRREGRLHPLGQVSIHWGRGLDGIPVLRALPGGGWVAVDLRGKISTRQKSVGFHSQGREAWVSYLTPQTAIKLDATLGWNARPNLKFISQLQIEHRDDGSRSRLALSMVRGFGGPVWVELGAIAPLDRKGDTALKLGLWLEF